MKWFYNLKRAVRVVIAVAAWLPLIIFSGVIGGSVGENAENLQTWQAVVFIALLAVAVVFTVFAVRARKQETQAAQKDASPAAPHAQNTDSVTPARPPVITMSDAAVRSPINAGVSFPLYTKAVGVTFDNCQERIKKSASGDPLLIKHNPTDEYPESTDIINARTHGRVGRISADVAWSLLTAFDEGFVLDGEIKDITGGLDGQKYGCNIVITGEHAAE